MYINKIGGKFHFTADEGQPQRGVVYLKSLINGAFARLAKYSDAEHKKADTEVSAFYLKNRFGVRNFKAREDF